MQRVIIGGFTCMAIVTLWQLASMQWMPWNQVVQHPISEEKQVAEVLKTRTGRAGVYVFPTPPAPLTGRPTPQEVDAHDQALRDYQATRLTGPVGMLFYYPNGIDINFASRFQRALAANMLTALAAGVILWFSLGVARRYWQRVIVVVMLSLFGGFAAYGPQLVWRDFPTELILALGWDLVLGWFVAGLVLAAIIKPEVEAEAEIETESEQT